MPRLWVRAAGAVAAPPEKLPQVSRLDLAEGDSAGVLCGRICRRGAHLLVWSFAMNPQTRAASGALYPFSLPVGPVRLVGELVIPHAAVGVVIFAHGSGSSRHSPRNQFV